MRRTQDMQPAAPTLERVVTRFLRKAAPKDTPLLAWPLACGSTVAARTRAFEFEDGILQVEVPDSGWRKELQALAPRYLAILNRYASGAIKRVEFVVASRKQAGRVPAPKKSSRKRA